jgi:Flp pilus assembly protein TadG
MTKDWFYKKNGERGQSFMELAVSLSFLLILFSAMVDLGWAFYTLTSLRDLTQEAASYGSMCTVDEDIRDRLWKSASSPIDASNIAESDISICIIPNGSTNCLTGITPQSNDSLRVTVQYEHKIVTPFVGAFIGNVQSYTLKAESINTILSPYLCP